MTAAHAEPVSERFGASTNPGGQGLGLATVKSIVEGHQGTVFAESSVTGTTFELAFPLAGRSYAASP